MHLIINLVFLTAFQFISLSNFKLDVIALWANNRRKWITVILINLCGNLLYYMIYLCLLSLCLCLYLFFLFFFFVTHPVLLPTLWFYCTLSTNTLPFLFLESWITFPIAATCPYFIAQLPHRYFLYSLETLLSLSLSLSLSIYIYIYNIREIVTNVRVTIHKDTNRFTETQTPQAQILRF